MIRRNFVRAVPCALALLLCVVRLNLSLCYAATDANQGSPIRLHTGWKLQSSRLVKASGDAISKSGFQTKGWFDTVVPATVVAAQVAAGEFKDPYFGMNLRDYPGMSYPIGFNTFNNLPMEKDSPYAASWWYRTEFRLPQIYHGHRVWLQFKGINYRANLWVNGRKLANSIDVAGAYRAHEFDVTSFLDFDSTNVLAVEVFAPTENDLGINWVDWNPTPPDKEMGIWGDVYLSTSGPVSVRYPMVATHFADASLQEADLTVTAQLHNASSKPVQADVEALLEGIQIRQQVELQPGEIRSVSFAPERFPELRVKNPKLWWPAEVGTPTLRDVTVRVSVDGSVSDEQHSRFGIREITSELTENGRYRLFRVNGQKILIRGAAWTEDMLLRPKSEERLQAEFAYVRDMQLNTIRLEGQLGGDDLFNAADEQGILVMAGWCCCDVWEKWDKWSDNTLRVATESLRTEALRLRSHPSVLTWLDGSDGPPPPKVERAYLQTLKNASWPNPIVSSAADISTEISGPSGVKMTGPYEYEPPSYWLLSQPPTSAEMLGDARYGGGFGYNTETSPGPAIPPLQSLRKMLPKDHLWPIDKFWEFHGAGERFMKLERFKDAMNATYGQPDDLDHFLLKAQAMAYDGERAMFEAYGRNKYSATGVIQWMLNNAWPSTYWHLYDYYLYPAGGYFGAKKANEPLHVQYSYDDRSVVVVNNRLDRFTGLTVNADVYDWNLKQIFSQKKSVDADSNSSTRVLTLPQFPSAGESPLYFVKLRLQDGDGHGVSSNFYWLPAKLSAIDWDRASRDTDHAPIASYEDLTALNRLPRVGVQVKAQVEESQSGDEVRVTLHNPTQSLAFQVHLGIRNPGSEDEFLPVLWDDNYISLLPDESIVVTARYLTKHALEPGATLAVDGWNVDPVTVPVAMAGHAPNGLQSKSD
jgi:exo-1,4-beta-D-glucosaminidase